MKKPPRSPRAERPSNTQRDSGGAVKLDVQHLRRLAEFRYRLRLFLHVSQTAAEEMGLRTQQYQLLQCVGGIPEGMAPNIANVAARMLLKHNSAVELVDRSVEQGLLRRSGDDADHRRILLRVTAQGERILASLSRFHTRELEQSGPELVRALDSILHSCNRSITRGRHASKKKADAR